MLRLKRSIEWCKTVDRCRGRVVDSGKDRDRWWYVEMRWLNMSRTGWDNHAEERMKVNM